MCGICLKIFSILKIILENEETNHLGASQAFRWCAYVFPSALETVAANFSLISFIFNVLVWGFWTKLLKWDELHLNRTKLNKITSCKQRRWQCTQQCDQPKTVFVITEWCGKTSISSGLCRWGDFPFHLILRWMFYVWPYYVQVHFWTCITMFFNEIQ